MTQQCCDARQHVVRDWLKPPSHDAAPQPKLQSLVRVAFPHDADQGLQELCTPSQGQAQHQ